MITAINNTSTRTQLRKLPNNNQSNYQSKTKTTNLNSPNFKSGAVVSFIAYTAADYVAIIGGCSNVDWLFRRIGLRDARDFGVRVIKRKHKAEFAEISNLTAHISNSLKQNPKIQKAGKRLQKTYETVFQKPLKIDASLEKPKGTTQDHLDTLYDKIEDLFVNMDDKDRFTAIGKPLLTMIEKATKALTQSELVPQKVPSKRQALSGTLSTIGQRLQTPSVSPTNVPRSQHP